MPDIIQLLPDSIANQIAAGEVIQRPASVVKEMLENAIDAGADAIKLIIKDAGKTSIQVIDNGKGMSETDARMSFERHATSKIRTANDLFAIKTMGFRGEALASIAAIAHVEMITRQPSEELGSRLIIEGSKITKQEPFQANPGTSITVKNLFYNVPARRKFLKSDPVELKHILDEFHRVVLATPDVHFTLHHNGNEIYHLPKTNLKQRIVGVIGKHIIDKLVPVNESIEDMMFTGFIGKAEGARKTAGEQYIFVNNRFIKSTYLNHAIRTAYEDLITKDMYPIFFLFIDMDPAKIDINVHPTKTEIKFEDERLMYNYLRVSLRHALGQYSLTPMIDFGTDTNFSHRLGQKEYQDRPSNPQYNPQSNPSTSGISGSSSSSSWQPPKSSKDWQDVYKGMLDIKQPETDIHPDVKQIEQEAYQLDFDESAISGAGSAPIQLQNTYIVTKLKSSLLLIDQQAAHERILYEIYLERLQNGELASQRELFPITIELSPAKANVLKNILDRINALGFDMSEFGHNSFVIHGTPVGLDGNTPIDQVVEGLLDQYTSNLEVELSIEENLARSMAASSCVKRGRKLEKEEMTNLIDQLFACKMTSKSPTGKKCFITIDGDELAARFK